MDAYLADVADAVDGVDVVDVVYLVDAHFDDVDDVVDVDVHPVADTNEVSTARNTSRWYCQGVPFKPAWPPGTVLLLFG